jgi:hypothetical protein
LKAVQDDELRARKTDSDLYIDWEMLRSHMPFGPASHAGRAIFSDIEWYDGASIPGLHGANLNGIVGVSDDGHLMSSCVTTRVTDVDGN